MAVKKTYLRLHRGNEQQRLESISFEYDNAQKCLCCVGAPRGQFIILSETDFKGLLQRTRLHYVALFTCKLKL